MGESASFELINIYLERCSDLTEKLLNKALTTNSLSKEENRLAKEINHVANVLSAIYFYRQEQDLEKILLQIPLEQKQSLEPSLRIIWKYLEGLNEDQVAQLAVETIQASSLVSEQIECALKT